MKISYKENLTKGSIIIKKDVWAKGQIYVQIDVSSDEQLLDIIENSGQKLINLFKEKELERKASYYKKFEELSVRKKVMNKFGAYLFVPKGYKVYDEADNFMWIHHETPKLHQGIVIYSYEYKDTSDFMLDNLVKVRDYFAKKYVPGDAPGSYMKTDTRYPIIEKRMIKNETFTVELRGMWNVENDFMGGPFVSYSTIDQIRNRIITIEGFVYAGNQKKKNYVWDLESIMNTFKLMDDNKKVNKTEDEKNTLKKNEVY